MEGIALLTAAAIALSSFATTRSRSAAPAAVIANENAPSAKLSLERPRDLPRTPSLGQDAKFLREYDAWTLHPGHEVSPRGVVSAFLLAERGNPQVQCDLITDLVEGDCSLRNLFEQREQSVAGSDWVVQGDGSDANSALAARVLAVSMQRLQVIEAFQHLLTANRYGWGAVEIDWGLMQFEGRTWIVPIWLTPVAARRFRIAPNNMLRLYADAGRPEGDELKPGKWIVLACPGPLARAGLMRTGAWPAVGKRLGWRDWLIFSQRFGLPLPLASYDPENVDDDVIAVAEEIVRRIGSDGGAVKPKSIELTMLEATKGESNDKTHGGLIAHCNAELAKLVSGSTLVNDNAGSGGASYALGEVHASASWGKVTFDASKLQQAVRTQMFAPFMIYNGLGSSPAPHLKMQVARDLAPKAIVEVADIVQNKLGIKVSQSQIRQVTSLRVPSTPDDEAPGASGASPTSVPPAKEAA